MEAGVAAESTRREEEAQGQPPGAGMQQEGPPGLTGDSSGAVEAKAEPGDGPSSLGEAAPPEGQALERAHGPDGALPAAEDKAAEPHVPPGHPGAAAPGLADRQEQAAPAGHDDAGGLEDAPSGEAAGEAAGGAEEPAHKQKAGEAETGCDAGVQQPAGVAQPAPDCHAGKPASGLGAAPAEEVAAALQGDDGPAAEGVAASEKLSHAGTDNAEAQAPAVKVESEAAADAATQQPAAAAAAAAGAAVHESAVDGEAVTQPAGEAPEAVPAAEALAAPAEPPAPLVPGVNEEQHPLKPQWRRGYTAATTQFLFVTVTQGDCNSRRMRPPRAWYDALMGGAFGTFEVTVTGGGGEGAEGGGAEEEPPKYYLQAHAYEYCKSEYYVQGSECKNMFRALALQPGDGLVLLRSGALDTGMPCVMARVIRAAENPYAPLILNAAASAQARRLAAAADPNRKRTPKRPAGEAAPANRKRKMAPTRATDGMASYAPDLEGGEAEGSGRARRSARSRRFPYGDDFITDKKHFWDRGAAAAAAADEEAGEEGQEGMEMDADGLMLLGHGGDHDQDDDSDDGALSEDSRGASRGPGGANRLRAGGGGGGFGGGGRQHSPRPGGPAAVPPPKSPLLAMAAAAAVQQQQEEERRASPEKPRVMALKVEGRNVLRIKLGFKRTAAQAGLGGADAAGAAAVAAPSAGPAAAGPATGGGLGEPSRADQPAAGGGRASLPAAAVAAAERQEAGGSGAKEDAGDEEALDTLVALAASLDSKPPAGSDVTLLSKSLVRDGEGRVVAAQLKLGWEPDKTAFSTISRHISEFGARNHDLATVEDFEVQPAEHQIRVTLRVAEPGKVDVLERAVRDLVAAL